jgi:transcriptional regulator with XRE-family HTH domain
MFDRKLFAARVRNRRLELGIGVRELARQLDVVPSAIAQYEDGNALPALGNLVSLADALNCSTDYLLGRVMDRYDTKP